MKQVLQSLSTGEIVVEDIPAPSSSNKSLLIATSRSLISAGTERMLLNFGRASIIGKVKQQPDKVKQVLDKVRTDGLMTTLSAVKSKLDQPVALGYCNVGRVLAVGSETTGFQQGDRVVSNGSHAEVVRSPQNLTAKIPDNVSDDEAVFTVLAAIGLQGVRLAMPTLGETFVVIGLGTIGLLTVQLLVANGCRVIGVDLNENKLALARRYGAMTVNAGAGEDPVSVANSFSRGRGVDGVLITASTQSNEIVHQAAMMCRKRGRIILVGVTGLSLLRDDFYEKELTFQVSCSYGPGRYDDSYEQHGHDYPIGFVRWTEQRNFEAVLDMMSVGKLDVKLLQSHEFCIEDAHDAYDVVENEPSALGILLRYPTGNDTDKQMRHVKIKEKTGQYGPKLEIVKASFIGAGNYASRVLIPAFKKAGAHLSQIVSSTGVSSVVHGKKQGFDVASTDTQAVYEDLETDAVVIATQHNQHAKQVVDALRAGKHVFVEKPLALTMDELAEIRATYSNLQSQGEAPVLTVGFNRRFSPFIQKAEELLAPLSAPRAMIMTVNAGAIPLDHWTQDPAVGGGRLIGEGCHFVDLLRFLAGAPITASEIMAMDPTGEDQVRTDRFTLTLKFENGSIGTVHYLANGSAKYPKEHLTVFCEGRVLEMENYRRMTGYGFPQFRKMSTMRINKGQDDCVKAFVEAISVGEHLPIDFEELHEVARVCIDMNQALNA